MLRINFKEKKMAKAAKKKKNDSSSDVVQTSKQKEQFVPSSSFAIEVSPKTRLFIRLLEWYRQHRDVLEGPRLEPIFQPDIPRFHKELVTVFTKEFANQTFQALTPALENYDFAFKGDLKQMKESITTSLDVAIPKDIVQNISESFANAIISTYNIKLELVNAFEKILPQGVSLSLVENKKPVNPSVNAIIPRPILVPEPRIPNPRIPIPNPKIVLPKPEIIVPIYTVKELEIQLAEVERVRRNLPKNATKAEKKAAANAEQQIKNLLKAAKRAETSSKKALTKKPVDKKPAVKKPTTKKPAVKKTATKAKK